MPETLENETTAAPEGATTDTVAADTEARAALPAEAPATRQVPVGFPVQYFPETSNQPEGPGPKAALVTATHGDGSADLAVFMSRSTHFVHRVPMGTGPGTWKELG